MTTSPSRLRSPAVFVCVAGLFLAKALGGGARAGDSLPSASTPPDAAGRDPAGHQGALLAVAVEPPRPHGWQCTSPLAEGITWVRAGDVLRLRVAAIHPDGRASDITGSTIRYATSSASAGVAPSGWIRFYPDEKRIRHVRVAIVADGAVWVETFVVISPRPVELPEAVRSLVARDFPGLRIPDDADMTYEWITSEGSGPFMLRADFDGNGFEDTALVLLGGSEWKIVLFNQKSEGIFETGYAEAGRHGPGESVVCPQQITLGLESGSPPALHVEIIGSDVFNVRWNGTGYVHEHVDYGE
jgi:hypothetical protein